MGHARGCPGRGAPDSNSLTGVRQDPYGQLMPDNDDARWELPAWDRSSDDLSRWKPEPQVPRTRPHRGPPSPVRPGTPAARAAAGSAPPFARGPARPVTAGVRREPPRRASPLALPLVWWAAHPWVVVWALVVLAPPATLALRFIDDSDLAVAVSPLTWAMAIAFVVAVMLAATVSAARSAARAIAGTVVAASAVGLVLWAVTSSSLGQAPCPSHAGPDLGAGAGASALDAWGTGANADPIWLTPESSAAWAERTRDVGLVGYRLVGSGCWDRMAPVDVTRTWSEFRVTVRGVDGAELSKTVVIHTKAEAGGWKITEIEGPLP